MSSELAEFLRARRERLTPAEVGLPTNGRRRTPGLRREEVAALAGVSIDYLVRLEQGRDTNPSSAVLAALAGALRLSEREKHHLGMLAARTHKEELCPAAGVASREVAASVRLLLDRLAPSPAFLLGPLGDLLAWNEPWERLVRPMELLDATGPDGLANLARYVFLHPAAPTTFPDWERVADEQVARLRAATVPWASDPQLPLLLADLEGVPSFAARWSAHEVADKGRAEKEVVHPTAGVLQVATEVLAVAGSDDQRIVVWLPADAASEAAMAAVTGAGPVAPPSSPARLRVVAEG